jgi:cytochrome bd ubiquinol oxidase subunit II
VPIPLDYETLRLLWWGLSGAMITGFIVLEGVNLGTLIWLPSLTRSQIERRILIHCIRPTWEASQLGFVLGVGALLTAWPMIYALSRSGFYFTMFITLFALILRPTAFRYRAEIDAPAWRKLWDAALFSSAFIPTLILGITMGNMLQGLPFYLDANLHPIYTGTLQARLNPLGLWCGMLSLLMLTMHAAFFLVNKTEGHLQQRACHAARSTAILMVFFFIAVGVWLYFHAGYTLTTPHHAPLHPEDQTVLTKAHAWLLNYYRWPALIIAPVLAVCMPLAAAYLVKRTPFFALICSATSLTAAMSTFGFCMFPFLVPSSTHPDHSLTLWNSMSSHSTLFILFIAVMMFFPIVLIYLAWTSCSLYEKITADSCI